MRDEMLDIMVKLLQPWWIKALMQGFSDTYSGLSKFG